MDKIVLKEFSIYLKKTKYVGIVQDLKLEYDDDEHHIYLALIRIRKKYRSLGYGSKIMLDIIAFANVHQIEVRLYATNIYGAELQRLYTFYRRFGFVLENHNNDGRFVYRPKKILILM